MDGQDHDLLIRIDERLEKLESELLGNGQPGVIEKHDQRITRLENFRWLAGGAIALFGFAASLWAALK